MYLGNSASRLAIAAGLLATVAAALAFFRGSVAAIYPPGTFLNTNAAYDTGHDYPPQLAGNGEGQWVAAWPSNDSLAGTIGSDLDILVARSTNGGASWSEPAPMNSNASSDESADFDASVQLATDEAGTWVAVWESPHIGGDRDIYSSRSTDNGMTWSKETPVNLDAGADTYLDTEPSIAYGGDGEWLVVWDAYQRLGFDDDLFASRSSDDGLTWSPMYPVADYAGSDIHGEFNPRLDGDGIGTFVLSHHSGLNGGQIVVSRSTDSGTTWVEEVTLNSPTTGNTTDRFHEMATDRLGNWLIAWEANPYYEPEIAASVSTDNGATWNTPFVVNTDAMTDIETDTEPTVALDGSGNWVVAWWRSVDIPGVGNGTRAMRIARSSDGGSTWTDPADLVDYGTLPEIFTDGTTWILTWGEDALSSTDNDIAYTLCDVSSDADCDAASDKIDNCPAFSHGDQSDPDQDGLGNPCDEDDDGDGCTDTQELGTNEELGGLRDPNNPWDFYDIDSNGAIDLLYDIFGVADRYGANDAGGTAPISRYSDPDSVPPPAPAYHPRFDRSVAPPGADPWDMGPPNGTIDLFTDIFGAAVQYGHRCA